MVLTSNLSAVEYGYAAKITYTLQFDIPSDTIGRTPQAKAKTFVVGVDPLLAFFKGSDLNTLKVVFRGALFIIALSSLRKV